MVPRAEETESVTSEDAKGIISESESLFVPLSLSLWGVQHTLIAYSFPSSLIQEGKKFVLKAPSFWFFLAMATAAILLKAIPVATSSPLNDSIR